MNTKVQENSSKISWGNGFDGLFLLSAIVVAGFLAKLPNYSTISEEHYYVRNIGFIAFLPLIAFFVWEKKLPFVQSLIVCAVIAIAALYINFLPGEFQDYGDTVILACIHLPLFLWVLFGVVFTEFNAKNADDLMMFLRHNADLVVVSVLILIAGSILTGITLALFETIELDIQWLFVDYIIVYGVVSIPIVSNLVISRNPSLVHMVSPIVARIFSPLALLTVVGYLVSVIYTGKDPYNDREFLWIFNLLLIGVMGLVVFSIAEFKDAESRWNLFITIGLVGATVAINAIALSAIGFRITEWGLTPNRLVVLGENALIFAHLIVILVGLINVARFTKAIKELELLVTRFLPVYGIWTGIVIFILPAAYQFQ